MDPRGEEELRPRWRRGVGAQGLQGGRRGLLGPPGWGSHWRPLLSAGAKMGRIVIWHSRWAPAPAAGSSSSRRPNWDHVFVPTAPTIRYFSASEQSTGTQRQA